MSFLDTITNIGKGVKDFFSSDTVSTIANGAKTVLEYMKDRSADVRGMGELKSLADPNTQIGGKVPLNFRRSVSKQPSFSDVQEASFYKYAQLQNTVRYLYNQKARYKSIAKAKS